MSFNQTVQRFISLSIAPFSRILDAGLFDCVRRLAAAEFGFCIPPRKSWGTEPVVRLISGIKSHFRKTKE
ncbi:hypothetical protein IVB45_07945 [Bradyrhizobium sp. 4]|uniref:hypothetical protein n=1 Tax=unclassified Bradyrhizobium TaxID=2631580 RepID=UPI001FF9FE34|nr:MULTISPECIES: hypothetical protein [unclassified Bradyrhizobium]MCK1397422.1 hypothetical protein [Bradyrhizobium sp. 39]MCK1752539.1 hypothetical protein [Bradyrhizobium sp. 135]UPJ36757.1 hypothetical protein IVB45_07945 [Bradyrhizobium sp. 4]